MKSEGIEYVICNLCGQDQPEVLFHAHVREYRADLYNRNIWDIVRCQNCGLIYTNPRIDNEARAALYSFETQGDKDFVHDWFIENADLQRPVWQRYVRVMRKYCPAGKLLDIGCGTGSFLVEARAMGYEVYGQEVSPYLTEYCRKEQGLTIYDDFLEKLDLQPGSFDCITAFDVIEHHPDPMSLVSQMSKLLRPNGVAVISTHDIGNPFARMYGVKWRYINPIGHITYFTRQTLTKMFEANNFHVLQVGGIHTIEDSKVKEWRNFVLQFFKVIVLRSLILGIYKPVTHRIPALTRWRVKWGNAILDHKKLLIRAGSQVTMNDDIVILVRSR